MRLRTQILLSILGITFLSQAVFGFLAYREISESRGDQLTIFLEYLSREVAQRIMLPDDSYVSEIYLEELRKKFSTPSSILIVQKNDRVLYMAGELEQSVSVVSKHLKQAYEDSDKHGLINIEGTQYYWAISPLPDNDYQLIMLQPEANEEIKIASNLRSRLLSSGFVVLWIAVWIGLLLSSKISRQLDEKNDQLKHLALHDALTGLPNRALLTDRLKQLLLQSQRNKEPFALFLMDLDRFKEVNDTLGHQFGDELLKMVSSRLLKSIRDKDSIARLGGDEFAVLLPQTDLEGALVCAQRIIKSMEATFVINDVTTESKASIGIALYPIHTDDVDVLMQYADVAMYQAKKSRSGFAIYDPTQNKHSVRRLTLMNDLRLAVENNDIHVYYQPIIGADKFSVTGVEALARWTHSELGNITPDEFIPMAEQMGLIRSLTFQVFKQTLIDSVKWSDKGYVLNLNVNVSTYCLQDLALSRKINELITQFSIEASRIELEITESALMHDLSRSRKIIDQLSASGMRLAIDDFGTGFSSLNYLKNLPVNTLKIDKSFIQDMNENESDKAIVKTVIELGHNLNCRVVAEGVENQAVIDSLKVLNVDAFQGYFYNVPLPADGFFEWLVDYNK